jgi:hypothetical protein
MEIEIVYLRESAARIRLATPHFYGSEDLANNVADALMAAADALNAAVQHARCTKVRR